MAGKFDLSAALSQREAVEMARTIEDVTRDVLREKARIGSSIIAIGKSLIEAKEMLSHGEWLPWLREQAGFSERSAQQYMQVAMTPALNSNPKLVSYLGLAKSIKISSLPEPEREEFVASAQAAGEDEAQVAQLTTATLAKKAPPHPEKTADLMELTKQDILSMTNMEKRKEFLDAWPTWPVWVEVPELGMTVRVVCLPDGSRITATRFAQHCAHYEHATLHRIHPGDGYSHMASSTSELAEYLTLLRKAPPC